MSRELRESDAVVYILARDGRDKDVVGAFERYKEYLRTVQSSFPSAAYEIATSNWYFDSRDRRCPHDGWLETLELHEAPGQRDRTVRALTLRVQLLGAYQDGHIEFNYKDVLNYSLQLTDGSRGHRDWRYDELRLSPKGNVVHEIEWMGTQDTSTWVIEAADVHCRWVAK